MSRRGRSGPAISLFSFQDIITSVTAIVTVITLLLALDLVQRKQSNASDSSSQLAKDLESRLTEAEEEFTQLSAAVNLTDDLVQDVAATSPAELREEIARRESAIVELKTEQIRLEQQAEQWRARLKAEQVKQFELEPVRQKTEDAVREATDLERQHASERDENRTVFSLPRGFQKEGWIAVVDQRQITVAPIGRPEVPIVFNASGLLLIGNSAAEEFMMWVDLQKLRSAYFLLLVRPDADSDFDEVEKLLSGKDVSHGFDLIGQDETIMHPERGAAP